MFSDDTEPLDIRPPSSSSSSTTTLTINDDDDEEEEKVSLYRRNFWLLSLIMITGIFLILYLLVQISIQNVVVVPDPPPPTTDISFRIFPNGSFLVSGSSNSTPPPEQKRLLLARERIKQGHLNHIREQLMNILLAGRTPPSLPGNITASTVWPKDEKFASLPPPPPVVSSSSSSLAPEIYAQRLQSFYPTCDITVVDFLEPDDQSSNDESFKKIDYGMKLYFDLSIPKSSDDRNRRITIMWAKLRLFMFDGPSCTDEPECPKLVTTVYQYVPPFKQNRRARVRLVDRRMIPGQHRGSIDFNIQSAINDWQKNILPNYGLLIHTANQFGGSLSAEKFFHPMNCSDPVLPIPNLSEIYGNGGLSSVNPIGNQSTNRRHYPTLDLMTVEVAKDDIHTTTTTTIN